MTSLLLQTNRGITQACRSRPWHVASKMITSVPTRKKTDSVAAIIASYEQLKNNSIARGTEPPTLLTRPYGVHCNNELDLGQIDVFGFDYDYTLAQYSPALGELIYNEAKRDLIQTFNYPESWLRDIAYKRDYAIRGLHYDTKNGLLLKMDAYSGIQMDCVHRGHRKLSKEEVLDIYKFRRLSKSYIFKHMRQLTDLFSLPEARLLADVIQALVENNASFDPYYPYQDVREVVRRLHVSGKLHGLISQDIMRYLLPNPALKQYLHNLQESGKKLFLLTNSPFPFVDAGMQEIFQSREWREVFDIVMVKADKPMFYSSSRPFRTLNTATNTPSWDKLDPSIGFEKGNVYWAGNVTDFMKLSGWDGSQILYFGDHVYNDLLDPAEMEFGWHTGAVIRELEKEIVIQNSTAFQSRLRWMTTLSHLIGQMQLATGGQKTGVLQEWILEREQVMSSLKDMFNPQFGSVFRCHSSPTYFASNITKFADIYVSRVENFANYPPNYHFHPSRYSLPHEAQDTEPLEGAVHPKVVGGANTEYSL